MGDRLAGDRLEVVRIERTGDSRGCIVDVVNRSGADLSLRYRVRWFSAEGREVRRGEPVWQDLRVAREGRGSLVSAVPAPWCVRFEIEFQP
ncbi:MAG: DUF1425 domain-containing protein [Planctomycetes bacterium]|nr:DUF1425 domain-containing protein [Planctomycetota bacterium]